MYIVFGGDPNFVAPMVKKMAGGGDALPETGGGHYAKVGMAVELSYSNITDGQSQDYKYFANRGPEWRAVPAPPGVTLANMPPEVINGFTTSTEDDAPTWFMTQPTLAKLPRVIAAFEWARYTGIPVAFQIQAAGSYGGMRPPGHDNEVNFSSAEPPVLFKNFITKVHKKTGGNFLSPFT